MRTLAERLQRGAAFFIDYGFPDAEYYLPERRGGTLMCHRAQRSDTDPLVDIGDKDITSHVNFSAIALTAQDAGFHVLGYTSQAHFLINCGLLPLVDAARERGDWPAVAAAQKLLADHEMGELFKVLGLVKGAPPFDAIGFTDGDRSHRL
jgi:SAM-dependent MidA family methyltransferase